MPRARHDHQQGGPSQRQLRVGEQIRKVVSDLLSRGEVNDPVLGRYTVTVPEVRVSPDLRHATVFVMPLGGEGLADVLAALRRNDRFIRGGVARAVNLKYAPQLKFEADETFAEADRISRLLDSPQVRRDTDHD